MDFLTGHDGVDWAAGVCMVLMLWRLAHHKRDGFLWSAGAAIAWIVFNARPPPVSHPGGAIHSAVRVPRLPPRPVWPPARPAGRHARPTLRPH